MQNQTQTQNTAAAQSAAPATFDIFNGEAMQAARLAAEDWITQIRAGGNITSPAYTIPDDVLCGLVCSALTKKRFLLAFRGYGNCNFQVSLSPENEVCFPLHYQKPPAIAIHELSLYVSAEYMFALAAEIKKRAKNKLAWQALTKKEKTRLP